MKIEGDASTAGGLRALVASLDKMEAPDDAIVKGHRVRRNGSVTLSVDVEPQGS